jgi:CRP-like cAMP-binding protein
VADAYGEAEPLPPLFDVAWMPGYGGRAPPRWRRWAGRLLPAPLRRALVDQEARIEAEAALAALEAYDGLGKMLADERFRGHAICGQVTDVLRAIETRLAHLQHEHPALCAVVGAQRAAISVLKAAGAEVRRLHDAFKISSADSETLIDTHKRRVHEVRASASAVRPPSIESLVADLPLFRALPPDRFRAEWAALVSAGVERFAAGERVMEAGRHSAGALVIVSGFCKVYDGAAAAAAGRFLRLAFAGRAEGCEEWLAALEDAPGAKAAAVPELRTVVAETDVEAVRISAEALRALVAAAGPEALRELRGAYGREREAEADPALLHPTVRPADAVTCMLEQAEPVDGRSRTASPSKSVRLAWVGNAGEQGGHGSESA